MFLLVNKPKGITSHDVVDRVRDIVEKSPTSPRLRRVKVGHAGTLDPNATGLLIVGIGRESTKKLGKFAKDTTKTYKADVYLGEERDTDDVEGRVVSKTKGFLPPTDSEMRLVLLSFLGEQNQLPPTYSAIKIKGKEAYKHARLGKNVDLKPRNISIHSIKLVDYEFPKLLIETNVSSGTYVRALARDIGKKLGCGAYLKNLVRTEIGRYKLERAHILDDLTKSNWKDRAVNIY